ncbi:MAG: hypothetical protein COA99_01760 [Moraxellaceae bacterium]|nr:MAG: hypothetical protein COA99_01760 [Moraxellaceae bacterium]
MAKKTGPVAQKMQEELSRYRSLRQHDFAQTEFREQVYALKEWQSKRLLRTHDSLVNDERYRDATLFFIDDIYGGAGLVELSHQIERVMRKAFRILPEKVMRTANYALEFNALSAELDEAMTSFLFKEMGVTEVTTDSYIEAFRESVDSSQRYQQAALAKSLAQGLDKYVRSRLVYGTFKLVKKPSMKVGIGELYNFMDKGFSVMRPLGSARKFIDEIVDREIAIVDRIYERSEDPFGFSSV